MFCGNFAACKPQCNGAVTYEIDGLGGSVGCAVRLETRRSRVRPPPRSATFFRGDWSWNIFYGHSLPSAVQEGQLSVSGERMCTILEDKACPVHVWLGKLTESGPSCSKLTMSLVNDSLKFTSSDMQIYWDFLLKKMWVMLLTFFSKKYQNIVY